MSNIYNFTDCEYEGDLFVLFARHHDAIGEIAPEAFKETLYMKMYEDKFGEQPKKNPWEIVGERFRILSRNSAPMKHANHDFHDKMVQSVLVCAHTTGVPYIGISTFEDFVFILADNYIKVYKSKFKAFLQGSIIGLIGLIEAEINGKRRQEKSVTCDTILKEDFLSNLSYNSYYMQDPDDYSYVEFKIKIGKENFCCRTGSQPFLHLFLYFVKNGLKKSMTRDEIKKAILDEYVFGDNRDSPETITASLLPRKGLFG